MAGTWTTANVRRTAYDVTWNSVDLGGVDAVTPKHDLVLEPIKIGSAGSMRLRRLT